MNEKILNKILAICFSYFGISIEHAKNKTRGVEMVTRAKHLYCWFCYPYFTLNEIGSVINRHHSTVLHGRKKINEFLDIGYIQTVDAVKTLMPEFYDIMANKKSNKLDPNDLIDHVISALQSIDFDTLEQKKVTILKQLINGNHENNSNFCGSLHGIHGTGNINVQMQR